MFAESESSVKFNPYVAKEPTPDGIVQFKPPSFVSMLLATVVMYWRVSGLEPPFRTIEIVPVESPGVQEMGSTDPAG